MTNEVSAEELRESEVLIRLYEEEISKVRKSLCFAEDKLLKAKETYNELRARLVKAELAKRGLDWCTLCMNVFPKELLTIVLTKGVEVFDLGYSVKRENFSLFHRACPGCCSKRLKLNNLPQGTMTEICWRYFEDISVFLVQDDKEVSYDNSSVQVVKMPIEECVLPELSIINYSVAGELYDTHSLIERLFNDWKLASPKKT